MRKPERVDSENVLTSQSHSLPNHSLAGLASNDEKMKRELQNNNVQAVHQESTAPIALKN